MISKKTLTRIWATLPVTVLLASFPFGSVRAQETPVAVVGARVFDGDAVLEQATVLFRDGEIQAVGETVALPEDVELVDGTGKTLLPGLIDCHVHTFGPSLQHALNFGVTTVLDMFTNPGFAKSMRAQQKAGLANDRADLFSTGYLTTAEGGHGTQFGMPVPTLDRAEDAAKFIAERVEEGADFIKLVYEDGSVIGREIPTLDLETLTAAIAATHELGKLAVVHVSTWQKAKEAIVAGADGLVHIHYDEASLDEAHDAELIALAKEHGVFVVPTLSVLQPMSGVDQGIEIAARDDVSRHLPPDLVAGVKRRFPNRGDEELQAKRAKAVYERIGRLEAAGVPILAGTDAPNPGTAFGVSMHDELQHLVASGLTPVAALRAATSRPADAFGLDDRGRIVPGKKADLFLVQGDPTTEVAATLDIASIWKNGIEHERPTYEKPGGNDAIEPGTAGHFDDGALSGDFGSWIPSTDQMAGGKSTVELDFITPGANGSDAALLVRGELKQGFAFPWSGPMFNPAGAPMQAVDLSTAAEIRFYARGSGELRVLVFFEANGAMPAEKRVELSEQWQQFVLSISDFGSDGSDLMGVHFSAAEIGPFEFGLDEVEFTE